MGTDLDRDRVGILVVGAGFLGTQRAAAAKAGRSTRLVGVVDVDRARAGAVAGRFGGVAAEDLDAGLALEGVDAVVVATPHADHVAAVELALARGKHVLCEKPLAIEPDDAWRLSRQAEDAGLTLATGFNHRFYPPVRDALEMARGWRVGKITSVWVRIGHVASPEFLAGWHGDAQRSGGGTLIDNGPHACDLLRLFLGDVASAQGGVGHDPSWPPGCEKEAFGLFRNHQDAVGELHSSWNLREGYLTIEVTGTAGSIKVETAPWRLTAKLADGKSVDRRYVLERTLEKAHRLRHGCERSILTELDAFAGSTLGDAGANADGWDGCRAVEMVRAVYESARDEAEVSLASPSSSFEPMSIPARARRVGLAR